MKEKMISISKFLTQKITKESFKDEKIKRSIKLVICGAIILSLVFQLFSCIGLQTYAVEDDSIVGTWVFNDTLTRPTYETYNIDYYYLNSSSVEVSCTKIGFESSPSQYVTNGWLVRYTLGTGNRYSAYSWTVDGDYKWQNEIYKTITITGGDDITNETFITWLKANATKQVTNPTFPLTIDGTVTNYEYEEGMTWQEWCDSIYNTIGAYVTTIYTPDGEAYIDSVVYDVTTTDGSTSVRVIGYEELSGAVYVNAIDVIGTQESYVAYSLLVTDKDYYDGYQEGLNQGYSGGYNDGYNQGKQEGYEDGYEDGEYIGYSKGTSDELVRGFFGNMLGGIIDALDSIRFYEETLNDNNTPNDTSDDVTIHISVWTILCSIVILGFILALLKVWRGN